MESLDEQLEESARAVAATARELVETQAALAVVNGERTAISDAEVEEATQKVIAKVQELFQQP